MPALMVPVLLLGGILSGVFTPTEAGAVSALYATLVGAFFYRSLERDEAAQRARGDGARHGLGAADLRGGGDLQAAS